jgi:hypothetical protein
MLLSVVSGQLSVVRDWLLIVTAYDQSFWDRDNRLLTTAHCPLPTATDHPALDMGR